MVFIISCLGSWDDFMSVLREEEEKKKSTSALSFHQNPTEQPHGLGLIDIQTGAETPFGQHLCHGSLINDGT